MSSEEAGLFNFLIFFMPCGYLISFSALKYLIPVTSKHAIQKSGLTPIHSAADGQNAQCLELLIENGFDVNTLLADHISKSYDDERKTALYFAVCNNDIHCTEVLLAAGADPNLDRSSDFKTTPHPLSKTDCGLGFRERFSKCGPWTCARNACNGLQ